MDFVEILNIQKRQYQTLLNELEKILNSCKETIGKIKEAESNFKSGYTVDENMFDAGIFSNVINNLNETINDIVEVINYVKQKIFATSKQIDNYLEEESASAIVNTIVYNEGVKSNLSRQEEK